MGPVAVLKGGLPNLTDVDIVGEALKRGLISDGRTEEIAGQAVEDMLTWLVDPQRDFILDLSQFSAAYCTRQCGKTASITRDLIITALEADRRLVTYVNATYGEARRIMWDDPDDGLPAVLRRHGVEATLNITKMTATLPNGSIIECLGADNDGFERLRGNKRDLIVVDEAQKIVRLRDAMPVLLFCLTARKGRLRFIGTPNPSCSGYFHDVCTGAEPNWSVRKWAMRDIVTRPDIWQTALEQKAQLGWSDDDPDWRREGMGEWVAREGGLVLPVDRWGALYADVPQLVPDAKGTLIPRAEPVRYLGGFDRGFVHDHAAIVVVAYSLEEGIVYEVHSEELPLETSTDEQADSMSDLCRRFPGLRTFYVDDGTGQISEDWRKRHRATNSDVFLVPARKQGVNGMGRMHMIEELRSSCRRRRTLVKLGGSLHKELQKLSWAEDRDGNPLETTAPVEEADGTRRKADHQFDAFRYVWQEANAFLAQAPRPPKTPAEETAERRKKIEAEALNPRLRDPRRNGRRRRP